MGLIYWLSNQPQLPRLPEPLWQTLVAKMAHLGEYAVLALLLLHALAPLGSRWPQGESGSVGAWLPRPSARRGYALVLALTLLYAVSDEFHQSFVPNRTASVWDVLIDGCGVLVTVCVAARVQTGRLTHARNNPG